MKLGGDSDLEGLEVTSHFEAQAVVILDKSLLS